MQKKLLNQLIFDLLELKGFKEELQETKYQEHPKTQEFIDLINKRIGEIGLYVATLPYIPFETFSKEEQDYLTKLPIVNLEIKKILIDLINNVLLAELQQ